MLSENTDLQAQHLQLTYDNHHIHHVLQQNAHQVIPLVPALLMLMLMLMLMLVLMLMLRLSSTLAAELHVMMQVAVAPATLGRTPLCVL